VNLSASQRNMDTWLEVLRVIACVLMVEWGLIHILAGVMTIPPSLKKNFASYFGAIYGALATTDPAAAETLKTAEFWKYTDRALFQHGLNLLWIGVWSCVFAGVNYWPEINRMAWALFVPIWLFDWGYFLAIDTLELGGLMGEAQTYINATAGILTAILMRYGRTDVGDGEFITYVVVTSLLIVAGIVNKVRHKCCKPNSPPLAYTAEVTPGYKREEGASYAS